MDNNPNIYTGCQGTESVNNQPTAEDTDCADSPAQEQVVDRPSPQATATDYPQQQVPVQGYVQYPHQAGGFAPVYNPGYIPAGYNAQPAQPTVVYTPEPQYYPAPPQTNPYAQAQQSPADVYYNNRMAGVPRYHYGNPIAGGMMDNRYYEEQQKRMAERRAAEKTYRDIGNISGIATLICFGLAFAFSMLFLFDTVSDIYDGSLVGMSFINMFYTLFVVGGSFLICKKSLDNMGNGRALRVENKPRQTYPLDFGAPKNAGKTILVIAMGLGGCMIANYVSSLLLSMLEGFGIYSTYSSIEDPQNIIDVVAMFLSVAVMPALVEELSMRGILMTPMRKYGNGFAILASAYIFGVFHGNAAQIPFAFLCGLLFGYVVVVTNSVWTAVIIHGINNSLSCISSTLISYVSEDAGNMFYYISTAVFVGIGIIALMIYLRKYKEEDFALIKGKTEDEPITFSKKFGKFISSPAMIVMTVIYLIQAVSSLTTTPQY